MSDPRPVGISRLEQASTSTYGWQVRVQRRGVRFAKFFADGGYEGPRGSLAAACRWRDLVLRELERGEPPRVCRRSARNSSGVLGVSRVRVSGSNGASYDFWQAAWCPRPGEKRSVRFSIRRHGEREAFELAVEARRRAAGA